MTLKRIVGATILALGASAFTGALAHAAPDDAIPPLPSLGSPLSDAQYELDEPLPPIELPAGQARAAAPADNPSISGTDVELCGNPLSELVGGGVPSVQVEGDCDDETFRRQLGQIWEDCTDAPEAIYGPAVALGLTPIGCHGTPALGE